MKSASVNQWRRIICGATVIIVIIGGGGIIHNLHLRSETKETIARLEAAVEQQAEYAGFLEFELARSVSLATHTLKGSEGRVLDDTLRDALAQVAKEAHTLCETVNHGPKQEFESVRDGEDAQSALAIDVDALIRAKVKVDRAMKRVTENVAAWELAQAITAWEAAKAATSDPLTAAQGVLDDSVGKVTDDGTRTRLDDAIKAVNATVAAEVDLTSQEAVEAASRAVTDSVAGLAEAQAVVEGDQAAWQEAENARIAAEQAEAARAERERAAAAAKKSQTSQGTKSGGTATVPKTTAPKTTIPSSGDLESSDLAKILDHVQNGGGGFDEAGNTW